MARGKIGEGQLEDAICRCFALLLPDLHSEGFKIESRQAILLGRRIDLLLQTADGRTCIIELKAGAPPMPQVLQQILDYSKCWTQSFPTQPRPRLMVIGNSIPLSTEARLSAAGVESRGISAAAVCDALQR